MDKDFNINTTHILSGEGYSEDTYRVALKTYINNNTNKNEYDFLLELIELWSTELELYENNTEEQLRQITIEKSTDSNEEIRKDLLSFLQIRKIDKERHIKDFKEHLLDFKIRLSRLPKPERKIKGNLLNGKKLNIVERHKIANDLFNIDKTIRSLNILDNEKHKLLSFIFDCNEQTARELYNGTQIKRTPIREDLVNNYINYLKE